MNTFYRPGIIEMILHGLFNRHSWFLDKSTNRMGVDCWTISCRICLEYKEDAENPVRVHTAPMERG